MIITSAFVGMVRKIILEESKILHKRPRFSLGNYNYYLGEQPHEKRMSYTKGQHVYIGKNQGYFGRGLNLEVTKEREIIYLERALTPRTNVFSDLSEYFSEIARLERAYKDVKFQPEPVQRIGETYFSTGIVAIFKNDEQGARNLVRLAKDLDDRLR